MVVSQECIKRSDHRAVEMRATFGIIVMRPAISTIMLCAFTTTNNVCHQRVVLVMGQSFATVTLTDVTVAKEERTHDTLLVVANA